MVCNEFEIGCVKQKVKVTYLSAYSPLFSSCCKLMQPMFSFGGFAATCGAANEQELQGRAGGLLEGEGVLLALLLRFNWEPVIIWIVPLFCIPGCS